MKLIIGFLLYRQHTLPYLSEFLNSLVKASRQVNNCQVSILIGDNSGADNQNVEFLQTYQNWGELDWQVIRFSNNLGFSRAYNQLINQAKSVQADYFFVLNPDTLLSKEAISQLLKVINNDKSLGVVAPKILYWDFPFQRLTNKIDSCGLVLQPGLIFKDLGQGKIDHEQFDNSKIIGASGAAALFRFSALDSIQENNQYFDERFFMYKEDCDLAYRLFLASWSAQLVPEAIIYHHRSVASGLNFYHKFIKRRQRSRQEREWSFWGQHLLFFKHWSQQNLMNKLKILANIFKIFVFSLIFEQFLLKNYISWRFWRLIFRISSRP